MLASVLLTLQASAYGLPVDPLLDKPLAFEARIEPLSELLSRVGRELGTGLTVEKQMEGLKATVFTPARPARLTLAGLASVFDAEWTPVAGGYRLEMSVPVRNRLKSYLNAEQEELRREVERELRRGAKASLRSWDEIKNLQDETEKEFLELKPRSGPAYEEALKRRNEAGINRETYLIGHIFRRFRATDWAEFWAGAPYYASSAAKGGLPRLPQDSPQIMGVRLRGDDEGEAPVVRAFARYVPEEADLSTFVATFVAGGFGGSRQTAGGRWGRNLSASLLKHPFQLHLSLWRTQLATSYEDVLNSPLRQVTPVERRWEGPWETESDALEMLHRQSGMPIVAEALRRIHYRTPGPFAESTVREALERWQNRGAVRMQDGALLYRPGLYWSRRATEPPERVVRHWESRPDRDADALADLVRELTPAQSRALRMMASRKRLELASTALPALRVWGLLSKSERKSLLAGDAMPFASMRSTVREASLLAIIDGIFDSGSPSPALLSVFDAPWNPTQLGPLLLFASTENVQTGSHDVGGPDREASRIAPRPGIRLTFGPSPAEGMFFTIPR